MSKLDQQMTLPGGRKLGFNEYGPTDGTPLFYFHGSPSSRVELNLFADEALATTPKGAISATRSLSTATRPSSARGEMMMAAMRAAPLTSSCVVARVGASRPN